MAIYDCSVPAGRLALIGATSMLVNIAGVTVSVVEPVMPFNVALTLVEPASTPKAIPLLVV